MIQCNLFSFIHTSCPKDYYRAMCPLKIQFTGKKYWSVSHQALAYNMEGYLAKFCFIYALFFLFNPRGNFFFSSTTSPYSSWYVHCFALGYSWHLNGTILSLYKTGLCITGFLASLVLPNTGCHQYSSLIHCDTIPNNALTFSEFLPSHGEQYYLRSSTTAGNYLQCLPIEPFICMVQSLNLIM